MGSARQTCASRSRHWRVVLYGTISGAPPSLGREPQGAPRKGASLSLRFHRLKDGGTDLQILRLDIYAGGKSLVLRMRPDLGARFQGAFPGAALRPRGVPDGSHRRHRHDVRP